ATRRPNCERRWLATSNPRIPKLSINAPSRWDAFADSKHGEAEFFVCLALDKVDVGVVLKSNPVPRKPRRSLPQTPLAIPPSRSRISFQLGERVGSSKSSTPFPRSRVRRVDLCARISWKRQMPTL